jgi:hypothetical protein
VTTPARTRNSVRRRRSCPRTVSSSPLISIMLRPSLDVLGLGCKPCARVLRRDCRSAEVGAIPGISAGAERAPGRGPYGGGHGVPAVRRARSAGWWRAGAGPRRQAAGPAGAAARTAGQRRPDFLARARQFRNAIRPPHHQEQVQAAILGDPGLEHPARAGRRDVPTGLARGSGLGNSHRSSAGARAAGPVRQEADPGLSQGAGVCLRPSRVVRAIPVAGNRSPALRIMTVSVTGLLRSRGGRRHGAPRELRG